MSSTDRSDSPPQSAPLASADRAATLEPWLRRVLSDDLDPGAVEPAGLTADGSDPFQGVDWTASRKLILSRLPERVPSQPPAAGGGVGRALRYGMLAAACLLAASLLLTVLRRQQVASQPNRGLPTAGRPVGNTARPPTAVLLRPVSPSAGDSSFVRIDDPGPTLVGRPTMPPSRFDARAESAALPDALIDDPSHAVSTSMRYMVSP